MSGFKSSAASQTEVEQGGAVKNLCSQSNPKMCTSFAETSATQLRCIFQQQTQTHRSLSSECICRVCDDKWVKSVVIPTLYHNLLHFRCAELDLSLSLNDGYVGQSSFLSFTPCIYHKHTIKYHVFSATAAQSHRSAFSYSCKGICGSCSDLDASCITPAVCFWLFHECQVTVSHFRSGTAERICHHSRNTSCWLRTQKRSGVV